jgi:hypothetical protein
MNKNNYFSKTLLLLAVGGGLTYIRKFKNNTENNNIDTIFDKNVKNNNNSVIYTEEERSEIYNEFIKSKKIKSTQNTDKNKEHKIDNSVEQKTEQKISNNEIKLNENIYTITNNELNINNNENIYRFYTNKDCCYKIKINIEEKEEIKDCLIIFNNFNYKISNNIIFDNIIFDNPYQTLEIKNNSLKKILIKEYPINHTNNGIIIINSYPYFLNKNLLPDSIETEKF